MKEKVVDGGGKYRIERKPLSPVYGDSREQI